MRLEDSNLEKAQRIHQMSETTYQITCESRIHFLSMFDQKRKETKPVLFRWYLSFRIFCNREENTIK